MIYSSYCEKTIIFCFWTKANYSRLSCHSNEIRQAKFVCSLPPACKISNKSHKRLRRYCTFIFSMSCRIASVPSHLSENEAKNLQNGKVHLAQIPDFEMEYLENHLEHWGQWWLTFLHFSRSFIWAKRFFRPEFPFKRSLEPLIQGTYSDKIVMFCHKEKQINKTEVYLAIIVLKWGLNSLFILPKSKHSISFLIALLRIFLNWSVINSEWFV